MRWSRLVKVCFRALIAREKQQSYRQFSFGDGELPFLQADVALREHAR